MGKSKPCDGGYFFMCKKRIYICHYRRYFVLYALLPASWQKDICNAENIRPACRLSVSGAVIDSVWGGFKNFMARCTGDDAANRRPNRISFTFLLCIYCH